MLEEVGLSEVCTLAGGREGVRGGLVGRVLGSEKRVWGIPEEAGVLLKEAESRVVEEEQGGREDGGRADWIGRGESQAR